MILNTILFDLDGTLLPINMDNFMKIYFEEMGKALSDLIPPKELITNIWSATEEMINNTEDRTNEEIFMEAFRKKIGRDISEFVKKFDSFYDEGFLKTRDAVDDIPIIRESIKLLKEKGYKMAIATNPLFPKKAILHRISWAGFNPEDFMHITCYEESHYCKPQLKFYEEVLRKINKNSKECMMVGNDVKEDLIAGKLGMQTFLIKDYILNDSDNIIESTYEGTYHDFYQFVKGLPSV